MFGSPPRMPVPPWEAAILEKDWQHLTETSRRLTQSSTGGAAFEQRMRHARELLETSDDGRLTRAMSDRRLVRAVIATWARFTPVAERTLRRETLHAIQSGGPLNRMAAESLLGLLLRHFDRLETWQSGLFEAMTALIRTTQDSLDPSKRSAGSPTETARLNPSWFLEASGPQQVAEHLKNESQSLESFLTSSGLRAHEGSDYFAQVKRWLFLEQIRTADRSKHHAFLEEIVDPGVYRAPMPGVGYFGHQLIEALVGAGEKPHSSWIDAILAIGDDPRLKHTKKWATWWAHVPQSTLDTIKHWLSAEDLRLFLAAVEEFGQRSGDTDMQRMFPARKVFLEGLLRMGLVRETRLFLGPNARHFVRDKLGRNFRSDTAGLRGASRSNTSVIFLDCGDFHFVEGSHSFRLWTYVGPADERLTDRRQVAINDSTLITDIPQDFKRKNGQLKVSDATHSKAPGSWQRKTIAFLEGHGIQLPESELIAKTVLQELNQRAGGIQRPLPRRQAKRG